MGGKSHILRYLIFKKSLLTVYLILYIYGQTEKNMGEKMHPWGTPYSIVNRKHCSFVKTEKDGNAYPPVIL